MRRRSDFIPCNISNSISLPIKTKARGVFLLLLLFIFINTKLCLYYCREMGGGFDRPILTNGLLYRIVSVRMVSCNVVADVALLHTPLQKRAGHGVAPLHIADAIRMVESTANTESVIYALESRVHDTSHVSLIGYQSDRVASPPSMSGDGGERQGDGYSFAGSAEGACCV